MKRLSLNRLSLNHEALVTEMATWTDTMLVCANGHQITNSIQNNLDKVTSSCTQCGKPTFSKCQHCNAPVPGARHVDTRHGTEFYPPRKIPAYCGKCGKPFPWEPVLAEKERLKLQRQKNNTTKVKISPVKKSTTKKQNTSANVFIVHGHDDAMKIKVARVLEHLKLHPIILHEKEDKGRTIIEKFEQHAEESRFAVVLLSPDDVGRLMEDLPEDEKPRARQNVILELGFFVGKLGRENVFVLKKDDVEIPSDWSGVIYTPFDSHNGWHTKLAKALKAMGFTIDMNDLP